MNPTLLLTCLAWVYSALAQSETKTCSPIEAGPCQPAVQEIIARSARINYQNTCKHKTNFDTNQAYTFTHMWQDVTFEKCLHTCAGDSGCDALNYRHCGGDCYHYANDYAMGHGECEGCSFEQATGDWSSSYFLNSGSS